MKVAIVGTGISGLTAALCLDKQYDITLFEKEYRVGGHTNTVNVDIGGEKIPIDTGFIVFNDKNYPMFSNMLKSMKIQTEWSDMSFGFSLNSGKMEYACDNIDKIFSQRINLLKPKFINGFLDVLRFQRLSIEDLKNGNIGNLSLGDYLEKRKFSSWLKNNYLLPIGASIWSSSTSNILEFPAQNFISFFKNHDLMTGLKPAQRWRTVTGGSQTYVEKIRSQFSGSIKRKCEVTSIISERGRLKITLLDGSFETFDHVILCCNASASRKILHHNQGNYAHHFKNLNVSKNLCVLHSDETLMPKRKKVWSSWNFLSRGELIDRESPVSLSYWMNRLQNISKKNQFFLSLNPQKSIAEEKIFSKIYYEHPIMNLGSFDAQKKIKAIQGKNNIWFAGAWLGNGFHEDGVVSALDVCKNFVELPGWAFDGKINNFGESLQAAE